MSNTIKIKKSNSAGATPNTLEYGELAINYEDGKLYYKDSSNNIKNITETKVLLSDTKPTNPVNGNIWFESDTGKTFVYYDGFWVEVGGEVGPTVPSGGTTGQVLAKKTNTNYDTGWANGGLKLLKTVTIGNAVSSVVVTDAFNADYKNYRVIITDPVGSITWQTTLNIQLGSASTGHYGGFTWGAGGALTNVWTGGNTSTAPLFQAFNDTGTIATFDISSPYLSQGTSWAGISANGARLMFLGGNQLSNTSFTDFTLTTSSGTITGGTIRIYGYFE